MWNPFKHRFGAKDAKTASSGDKCEFTWFEPGSANPFPMRVLDVRPLTWNVVAATKDPSVAESFGVQRCCDGREHIEAEIGQASTVECNLVFPHNGDALEGIVFKSDSMEVKWDIYIYNSVFLFVRSWTGQLQYRAFAEIGSDEIRIFRIETSADHVETAPQDVYFILGTHVMRRVLPHTIPRYIAEVPELIAQVSFSMYGKFACYATYEDITRIKIPRPQP